MSISNKGARASVTVHGVKFEALESGTEANSWVLNFVQGSYSTSSTQVVPRDQNNFDVEFATSGQSPTPFLMANYWNRHFGGSPGVRYYRDSDGELRVAGIEFPNTVSKATIVEHLTSGVGGSWDTSDWVGSGPHEFSGGTVVADLEVTEGRDLSAAGYLTLGETEGHVHFSHGGAWAVQHKVEGVYGTLTLESDGDWTYELDDDSPQVQALDASDTVMESFEIVATHYQKFQPDQRYSHMLHITINGTSVDSMIDISGVMEAWEDQPWKDPAGYLISQDWREDHGLAITVNRKKITTNNTVISAQYGSIIVDMNGYWEYNLDNNNEDVEALDGDNDDADGANGTLTERIEVTFTRTDGSGNTETRTETLSITINGSTDASFDADGTPTSASPGDRNTGHDGYGSGEIFYQPEKDATVGGAEHHTVHGDDISTAFSTRGYRGNDVLHGNDNDNKLFGNADDDVIFGYGGNDELSGGLGNDILDGGSGFDTAVYQNKRFSNLEMDLGASLRWKYNRATGEWESGNGEGYDHVRVSYDVKGAGKEYDFLKSIEGVVGTYAGTSAKISGDDQSNKIHWAGVNSVIDGRGGDDWIITGNGQDHLTGGKGLNILTGGLNSDTFVLYQGELEEGEIATDIVTDFSYHSDKIQVGVAAGSIFYSFEDFLAAANIRIEGGHMDASGLSNLFKNFGTSRTSTNDPDRLDTVIYDTRGTDDTSDDVVLMILEDYDPQNLSLFDFQIVPIDVA